ncbi:hypothetical protein SAMN05216481_12318 [Streptomyces radiopugnans]|uniref:Uncharacterized protein n=1 Tax=Streptomyces radiopugnans TaxID=403935 RepID=A0A1H9KFG9_9ACTN|nr:hypothetical protein SAMN05216481_12318 [Streptomyces radiopugnans]
MLDIALIPDLPPKRPGSQQTPDSRPRDGSDSRDPSRPYSGIPLIHPLMIQAGRSARKTTPKTARAPGPRNDTRTDSPPSQPDQPP